MIEAISTSDWHLEGMNKHFHDATRRQLAEVDRIYQYGVNKGIKHLFIPGDISETPHMGYSTYMQLLMFFKKYDGVIDTHYVGGNHDRSDRETTSCDLLKTLCDMGFFKTLHVYLEPTQTRIDGTLVNFCAWPCPASLSESEGSLNLAHITVTGAVGDNGRPLRASHDFGVHERDYTISGHIHQYQHLREKRTIFNGNPFQKNFGEALPKGFIHLKATTQKKTVQVKHRFINNHPQFQLETIHIESPKDFSLLRATDSKRYRLYVAEDVLIPKDLRIQFPNITGSITTVTDQGKKVERHELEEIAVGYSPSRIKPETGLKEFLSGEGHSKKEIRLARDMLNEAKNHLGL